jgi:hypothetical protein
MDRPRIGRGLGYGLAATALVAVVGAVSRGILDLSTGLIALAVGGGWAIGAAVRQGVWGGQPHRPSSAPTLIAAALGALGWLASLVGAWVVSMAILPASSRSLPDRLLATPFVDWLSPQIGLGEYLALLLFIGFAGFGARSAPTRT